MSKRAAEEQITKDGGFTSEDGNSASTERTATPDVLAKRKILQPKGRGFQFSNKSVSAPQTIASQFNEPNIKSERFKALANKFSLMVQQSVSVNAVPDLRPLAQKYMKYYEEIENSDQAESATGLDKTVGGEKITGSNGSSTLSFSSKPLNGNTDKGQSQESDSEDEPKKDIKVQGPKFQLNFIPTTKRSAFTFGAPKQSKKEDSSDSESEIEVKGPSFTFNKEIKDSVFKLSGGTSDKQDTKASLFSVSSVNTSAKMPMVGMNSMDKSENTPNEEGIDAKSLSTAGTENENESAQAGTQSGSGSNLNVDEADNEKVCFTVKAKLMLLKTNDSANPYQTLGVGELKVLKSEEGGSSRVVIRAEGGLRLLLNAHLIKDVDYTVMGNGSFVRLPALDDSHQIVTYVLKVGSADKGEKLSHALNSAKISD